MFKETEGLCSRHRKINKDKKMRKKHVDLNSIALLTPLRKLFFLADGLIYWPASLTSTSVPSLITDTYTVISVTVISVTPHPDGCLW